MSLSGFVAHYNQALRGNESERIDLLQPSRLGERSLAEKGRVDRQGDEPVFQHRP